jgi:hypothetical protein
LHSIRFEVKLVLSTCDPARDEAGTLQNREVLRDLRRRLGERGRQRSYGLVTALTETREEPSPRRMTQREENVVEVRLARSRITSSARALRTLSVSF